MILLIGRRSSGPSGEKAVRRPPRAPDRGRLCRAPGSNQIDYYLRTAREQERQARWLRVLALAFGAVGTVLAALGLQIYVAATTALVAVYTTLVEFRQLETSVTFYNQASADLGSIRAWWNALPTMQQDTQETVDRLVDRAERITRAEHVGGSRRCRTP